MRKSQHRFGRDKSGAVSIITAICIVMFLGFSAAAIDFGYVFLKARQLQGMADLAAMSAAANIANAQEAAQATADANGWSHRVTAAATTGTYQPLVALDPMQRFQPGGASPNAARVTLTADADLFFAPILLGARTMKLTRTATAAQGQLASFSIGTRLAGLNGGIANALLSGLTGSDINLSVMDYNALATAQVDLFQYIGALNTRMGLRAASFDQTLSGDVQTNIALGAVGDVLNQTGAYAAGAAVARVAQAANSTPVQLGKLIDLGPYGGQDYINAAGPSGISVNALDLTNAVLQLAQGGRQVQLNLKSILPGLAGVSAWLAIGERPANSPWLTVTDKDSIVVRTAQARLYVDAKVVPLGLPGVASIDLPLYLELAQAKAKLASLTCGLSANQRAVGLSVSPSIGTAAIGSIDNSRLDDFKSEPTISQAKLVDTLAISATGKSEIALGGMDWQSVSFDDDDIANHTIKTVSTDDALTAATASLVGKLNLNVKVLGLGLGVPAVTAAIQGSLKSVTTPLDGVLNGLEDLLGVGLGQADVWVDGMRCQNVALVQ
ncbi:MAG TPA: TadG family pilus assembly protein [Rhizomicrobium sp.]|nr:TadG family pilus assembly protein [Rhizomicrobium sp.]